MADPRVTYPNHPQDPEQAHYGEAPLPGAEVDLQEQIAGLAAGILNLEQAVRAEKREVHVEDTAQANTDGSGNATFPVYQVPAGMIFYLESLVVEAATFDASGAVTPAAPYSNAAFWLGIFRSPNPNAVSQGGLIDFLPTAAAAQGIPDVADYSPARRVSSGYIVCKIVTGPTSKRISVHYTGYLRSAQGG